MVTNGGRRLNWVNRGSAADRFESTFGGDDVNIARGVVDAVLQSWERVITDLNQPGGGDQVDMTISMSASNNGFGASAGVTGYNNGYPVSGNITISRGSDTSGDSLGDGGGFFLDTTPLDISEFQGSLNRGAFLPRAHSGSPASGLSDLFSLVNAEITHSIGLFSLPSRMNNPNAGTVTDTGITDTAEGGGTGRYFVFDGPSVTHLMTSNNAGAGGQDFGQAIHTAGPDDGTANQPVAFTSATRGPLQLVGSDGPGNAIYSFGERTMVNDVLAAVFQDAYTYSVTLPQTFGTSYAMLVESTGEVIIRGGEGTSADDISIAVNGTDLEVTVNIGNDIAGTGLAGDSSDIPAFVSLFPLADVMSITIEAGDGDDIISINPQVGVPINIDGGNPAFPNGGAGDELSFDITGVTGTVFTDNANGSGSLTSTSHGTVSWSDIEVVTDPTPTGLDFGDAPNAAQSGFASSYPVLTLGENGARHGDAGATLGQERDLEADGVHSSNADADDTTGGADDEDGVTFTTTLTASSAASSNGSVDVDLQNPAAINSLDAWIDFNQDGDWDDPGEQIFTSENLGVAAGVQTLNFTIPQDTGTNVVTGTTFSRFRVSAAGGLAPTGAAPDGEVEDHPVNVSGGDTILFEPFDDATQFTTSEPFFSIGDGSAFFGISDGAAGGDFGTAPPPIPTVKPYTNTSGNFLTGMDIDASGTGHTTATLPITTTWAGLDISGEVDLRFSADFAALDEGASGDPGGNIEPSDFIRVEAQIDGGGFVNIMEFRGNNTGGLNAAQFSLDTDGDGSGDGTLLSDALRNFSADIIGTGDLLDVRISVSVGDQDEDFAIDNVSVTADNPASALIVDIAADENDGDYSVGDLSLREAIEIANTHVGMDEIEFAPGLTGSTITLTIDQLLVTDSVAITGPGSGDLTISGDDSFRVLDLRHTPDVILEGLTITGGRTTETSGLNLGITGGGAGIRSTGTLNLVDVVVTNSHTEGIIADGGGIQNISGTLVIENSTVSNNSTSGSDAYGGGISSRGNVTVIESIVSGNSTASAVGLGGGIIVISADLSLTDSTISDNQNTGAGSFAGGVLVSNGNLTVSGSTISANTTTGQGGGIVFGSDAHTATVVNSTISNNTAGTGGGIFVAQGTFNLQHSTVTENTAPAGQGSGLASNDDGTNTANTVILSSIIADNTNSDVDNIISGTGTNTITSSGFNLIGSGNALSQFGVGSDQTGVSAVLGALADNGGPTFTHALLAGSPAINAGDTASAQATDQRGTGFARIVGGNADVGAFELEATNPSVTLTLDNANIAEAAGVATFTTTLSEISGEDVTVDVAFSGTATHSDDYTRSDVQIVIAAGDLSGTLTVTAVQDTVDDDAETVTVDISGVTNGTGSGTQQQTTTITDDDDAPTATPVITATPLTKVYDGTAFSVPATADDGAGGFGADTNQSNFTFTFYAAPNLGGGVIPAPSDVGTYSVDIAYAGNTDYTAVPSTAFDFTITAAALTATAEANNKVYDGTTAASVTVTLAGIIAGDTVTGSANGAFDSKNVGTGKTVTVGTITLSGADSGNYTVSAAPDTSADVTTAVLTATVEADDKVYDATTAASVTITLAGVIAGDTVSGAANGTFDNKNVGTDKPVTVGTVNLTGTDSGNYTVSAAPNTTASITTAALTSSATAADKVYDATTSATVTVTLGGVIAGDTVAATATGTFDDKNVGTDKPVTVGTVNLTGTDSGNYTVSAAPNTTASITTAALTSSATAADKVYDATTSATVTVTLGGVIAGDAVAATATGTFDDKNAGTGKDVTVGAVTLSGTDAGNYTVSAAADTTADITAAALTSSATAADKIYDTTTAAALTVALSGIISGDTVTATADGTFDDKNVGTNKTVTAGAITLAGTDAANYTVSAAADTNADITAAALTSSATAANKVYDATTTATVSVTLTGVIAGDTVTATADGTFDDKNVGTDKTVTIGSVTLAGADAGNYTVSAATNTTADVTAAALTSSATAADKVYDATTTAAVTVTLSGVITGDTVSAAADGTFDNKNVGTDKTVAVGAITLSGTDAANYTASPAADTDADITTAALTSSATAADKVYDATNTAAVTVTLSGVIAGDTVSATADGTFDNKNVGTGKTVAVGAITLSGTDAANYTVSAAADTDADITTAALTSSATAADKVYDATNTAAVTVTLSGVIAGDTVSATADGTFDNKNVGTGKTVAVGAITLSGTDAANYTASPAADTDADITTAALTSSATAADKVYDATNTAAVTVTLSGVIAGDTVSATANGTFDNKNVGTDKTVAVGAITLSGTDAANYTVSAAADTDADITPAALTVTAVAASKEVGNVDPALTFNTTGLVGGETIATALNGGLTREAGETVGVYQIQQGTLAAVDGNYTIAFSGAVFEITALATPDITVTANDAVYTALVYAGTNISVSGGAAPVEPPAVVLEYFSANDPITANAIGVPTDVGTYWVRAFYAGNASNNPVTTALQNFDITPVALTPKATAADKVYDATTTATVTVTLAGVIAGDTVNATAGGTFDDKNVGANKTVTVGTITLAGTDAANYTVTAAVNTDADITPAALTSSVTAADKVYDATTIATVTVTLSGAIPGDTVNATASGTFDNKNVGEDKAVTVGAVALAGTDAGNYTVSAAADTTADITPAALTSSATAADKVYDATTIATVTVTLSGVIAGDTVTATAGGTFDNKNVENNKAVSVSAVVLAGTDAGNYTVSAAADTTADITPAALTSSATAADKVYDATTAANVTVTLTGVIAGDTVNASADGTFDNKNVGTNKTVAVGAITLSGTDAANYTVSAAADTDADITAAALTVTANAATKVEGSADPTLTFVATGFVGGESAATALSGTLTREAGETVGDYDILLGTLTAVDSNYTITFVGANFSITPDAGGPPPATVSDVTFYNENAILEDGLSPDATGQRSVIRHIQVQLSGNVSVPTGQVTNGSFLLENLTAAAGVGLTVDSATFAAGVTTVVLSFTSGTNATGSLVDGNYRLTVDGATLGVDGNEDGSVGGQKVIEFHRLYGDSDGDRDVDGSDFVSFIRSLYGNPAYQNAFDQDNDNNLFEELGTFFSNFGSRLNPF